MAKYYARITRDIERSINMGELVVTSLITGKETVVTQPRIVKLPSKAGTVSTHATKAKRDAYIAAVNAEHPGAAEPA